jgi:hypothetical protein
LVEEGNQVPQDVAVIGLQQDAALAYAELLAGGCRVGEAGRKFCRGERLGGNVVDAAIMFICPKLIFLRVLGSIERGPGLAMGRDILARVLRVSVGYYEKSSLTVLDLHIVGDQSSLTSLTRQMRHSFGGEESGTSYCVPHTSQMARLPDSDFIMDA